MWKSEVLSLLIALLAIVQSLQGMFDRHHAEYFPPQFRHAAVRFCYSQCCGNSIKERWIDGLWLRTDCR